MRDRRTVTHNAVWLVLVRAMGSRCARCGFFEFGSVLEFHSIPEHDPESEVPLANIVNKFIYNPSQEFWDELLVRASGHALLCPNCHKALRAEEWQLTDVIDLKVGLERLPAMPVP